MKIKKEYILLAIIIMALSVYLFMRRGDRTLYELPEIQELAQKEITRLQITRSESVIDLKRKDDNWYLEPQEYPADDKKVGDMLDSLEKLTLTALVSESKNYNLYDLSEETGIKVKAWQEDSLKRDIDVGKTAPSYRHTFVKAAGDDRVFHARGNLRDTFDLDRNDLRDKTVLAFTPSDIQQIQIATGQQSTVLNRTQLPEKDEPTPADKKEDEPPTVPQTVWRALDGQTGDETAVKRLLNTLSNLRSEEFIEDREKEDLTSPLLTLELKGPQDHSLAIFAKAEEQDTLYPATSTESHFAFLLSDSVIKDLMEDASKLLKAPETDEAESQEPEQDSKQQKE